jgi:DNA-binding CsgD family transcriptional regulator
LEADIAGQGELGQEIVAQGELRFDGALVVGQLSGQRSKLGSGGQAARGTESRCADAAGNRDRVSIGRIPYFFANFAKRKSYWTGVKKSPQTGRDPNPANAKWDLTRRQVEVLDLLRTGAADKEIASDLGISRSTASKHVENILKKMKVTNRTTAVSLSWQN